MKGLGIQSIIVLSVASPLIGCLGAMKNPQFDEMGYAKEVETLRAQPREETDLVRRSNPLNPDQTLSATARSPGPSDGPPPLVDHAFFMDGTTSAVPFFPAMLGKVSKQNGQVAAKIGDSVGDVLNVYSKNPSTIGGVVPMGGAKIVRNDGTERGITNNGFERTGHWDFFNPGIQIKKEGENTTFVHPENANKRFLNEQSHLEHLRRLGELIDDPENTVIHSIDGFNILQLENFVDMPWRKGYPTLVHEATGVPRGNIRIHGDFNWFGLGAQSIANEIYNDKKKNPNRKHVLVGMSTGVLKAAEVTQRLDDLIRRRGHPVAPSAPDRQFGPPSQTSRNPGGVAPEMVHMVNGLNLPPAASAVDCEPFVASYDRF